MKKIFVVLFLIVLSLLLGYAGWAYWGSLTKAAALMLGVAIGAAIAAALVILLWQPAHPATRHQANLPSPWERGRWR